MEAILDDGVPFLATSRDATPAQLGRRVLPALDEAATRRWPIGRPDIPTPETLNALLAVPHTRWPDWASWRAHVVGDLPVPAASRAPQLPRER